MKKILISCILASSRLLSNSFGQLGLGYSKGDNSDNFLTAIVTINRFIFTIVYILIPGIVNASLSEELDGVWTGVGQQTYSSYASEWTISVKIKNGNFKIEYPSLGCSGTWDLLSETSGSVTFFENIQIGKNQCTLNGTVELLWIEKDKLRYIYFTPDGKINAFGELVCHGCNVRKSTTKVVPIIIPL